MKRILLLIVLLLVLAGLSWAAYRVLVAPRGLAFDVFVHYRGAQAVYRGEAPYTEALAAEIQMDMFGQRVFEGSNQHRVAYPAYAHVLLGPLTLLPPVAAVSLWIGWQLLAIILSILLWLDVLDWHPRPAVLALGMLLLLFGFRYPINVLAVAQFTGTVLLGISAAAWWSVRRRDALAGGALALATVPPTISGPLALVVLGGYALRGRVRGMLAFVGVLGAATLVSFALIGWWLPDFLQTAAEYAGYANTQLGVTLVPLPLTLALIAGYLGLLGWFGWRWWRDPSSKRAEADAWVTALLVAVALLPVTGDYSLTLLIPVIIAVAARGNRVWVYVACVMVIVLPWVTFVLFEVAADRPDTLLMPLAVAVLWAAVHRK